MDTYNLSDNPSEILSELQILIESINSIIETYTHIETFWLAAGVIGIIVRFFIRRANFQLHYFHAITLLGTFFHELAHAIIAIITFAKLEKFDLIPRKSGNYFILGEVQVSNLTWFNTAPIALAPLLLLFTPLAGSSFIDINEYTPLEQVALFVATSLITQSSFPSGQDYKTLFSKPIGVIFWVAVIFFCYFFYQEHKLIS